MNPAPSDPDCPLPASLLSRIELLTPNEHEASQILGTSVSEGQDWHATAKQLLAKGVGRVAITLGELGCLIADQTGTRAIPAHSVSPVDTTAAGDCFNGAIAVALAEGLHLDEAARFANCAAALSTTRAGAQPSLPRRAEVDALL